MSWYVDFVGSFLEMILLAPVIGIIALLISNVFAGARDRIDAETCPRRHRDLHPQFQNDRSGFIADGSC